MDTTKQNKSGIPEQTVVTSPPRYPGHPPQYPGLSHPGSTPVMSVNAQQISGATTVLVTEQMGPKPARVVCKSCHQQITTTTKSKASTRTHLIATLFCVTLLWPCVFIPYCVNSCRNTEHYCPNCDSYIGVHVN